MVLWFYDNYMEFDFQDGAILPSAEQHVVLGKKFYYRLTYSHLKHLCKKVTNKLNSLTRIAPNLSHNQSRLMCSSSFTGQLR